MSGTPWLRRLDTIGAVVPRNSASPERPPDEDLFSVLDAAALLLEAPLVLEDTRLTVLAWSGGQEQADDERVTGILDRRAPGWLVDTLDARGVFASLAASPDPLFIEPASARAKPRMAIAVRAGGELLGYLWATAAQPFTGQRRLDLAAIAGTVGQLLVRHRDDPDNGRARDHAAVLLQGGDADDAAAHLDVSRETLVVLAARSTALVDEPWTERRRVLDPFALHLSISHSRSITTFVGLTTYALIPWPATIPAVDAVSRTRRLAESFLRRVGHDLVIAVGGAAATPDEVASARADADLVLRLLVDYPQASAVATFADVQGSFVLSELGQALRRAGKHLTGPVAVLTEHDREQHTELLPTLDAYLRFFGDVTRAAQHLHVHPNTFRNRIHRIQELTGFDAADPEARFVADLQLRLRGLRRRPHRT